MLRLSIVFFFIFLIFIVAEANSLKWLFSDGHDPKNIHAVLTSSVPFEYQYLNYAPEAEIAHTYHLLRDNGVPANNIILFMNGKFADSEEHNPWPGTLYTDKNRSRNYNEGLQVDYSGDEVTPENFLAVIRGEKDKVVNGSGRVLESNENNRVFFSHESHGDVGVFLFPEHKYLTLKDLYAAFGVMQEKKMFKELVYYVMACRSGSMFEGHLSKTGNIYAMTAVKPIENATAFEKLEKDDKFIYVNTHFGKAWMTDTETHNSDGETLETQFEHIVPLVDTHVSQYGNLKIAQDTVSDFEGETNVSKVNVVPKPNFASIDNYGEEPIPIAPIAEYLMLKRQMMKSKDFAVQLELSNKLSKMEEEQEKIINSARLIVQSLLSHKFSSSVMEQFDKSPNMITRLDCHDDVVKSFQYQCQKTRESIFFTKFLVPMVNLCEQGFDSSKIIAQMKKYCL